MNTPNKVSRILGVAFLLQFVTSFSSGVFVRSGWDVPGNIPATMIKIANHAGLMQANFLLDMGTALGVIFLGAMLFVTLRQQSEKLALTALSFYILEGALLAASRLSAFSLLRLSQEYASAGQPALLQTLGGVAYESMDFVGSVLHMLAFCTGGILFYYLLFQSRVVPRWLSLWGIIAVIPCFIGTVGVLFGYPVPFAIYLPYLPFELVIGLWILVRGVRAPAEAPAPLAAARAQAV